MDTWKSQVIEEWRDEGRQQGLQQGLQLGLREGLRAGLREGQLEAQRRNLLKVLRVHFPPEVPADVAQAVQKQTDPDLLVRWFDAALTVGSLDEFRKLIAEQAPLPPPQN